MDLVIIKDINCLNTYKISFLKKKKILIFDWRAFYFLRKKKLKVIFASDLFPSQGFENIRKKNDLKVKRIIRFLNENLHLNNNFFKKKKWYFYDNFFLEIKGIIDTCHYVNLIITKVFKKFKIKKVYYIGYPNNYSLSLNNKFYSLVDFVIENNKDFSNAERFVENVKIKNNQNNIINKIKNLVSYNKNLIKFLLFLSLPVLKKEKLFVLFSKNDLFKNYSDLYFISHFLPILKIGNYKLKKNKNIFIHNNLNLESVLRKFIYEKSKVIFSCMFFYQLYKFKIKNFKIVFFKYCRGDHPIFVLLKQICDELKIKYCSWSHGFHGITKTNHGWEYTDFRNVKHIGVCSELENKKKFKTNKFYNVGLISENYNLQKLTKKKTILLIAGYGILNNNFYYAYNRKGVFDCLGEDTVQLIELLSSYSKKYNIIFKDYPFHEYYKNIVSKIGKGKIEYISNQENIGHLLAKSDLNIFLYASNTFADSLHYRADSFILEPDLGKNFNTKYLKPFGINFYKNITSIKKAIHNKLNKNIFHNCKKNELVEKYFTNVKKYESFVKKLKK